MNQASEQPEGQPPETAFPVVAIGASAGGLDALSRFLGAMPGDMGVGFVVISHLDPSHDSMLSELLDRRTALKVREAEDKIRLQPDCVHIIPPDHFLTVEDGVLHLSEPLGRRGTRMPIDHFFRSLAEDRQARAICIILSGAGSDGTLGLREIKAQGGLAMVQAPETAQHDGMPRSALNTGMVDYVLPVEQMPEVLRRYVDHPYVKSDDDPQPLGGSETNHLQRILALLHTRSGHDFRCYKKNTLLRRIQRRMSLHRVENLEDYLPILREHPDEINALVKDLLISVTSFFRDPEAWEILGKEVIPTLLRERFSNSPLRIWIPGCASGEEAYSLAILMLEHMERAQAHMALQIFATDIDRAALEVARNGVYPENITSAVSPERLNHFFEQQEDDTYRVSKPLRESIVFAPQNVVSDPPFSSLDLITCRNLLIYLESSLQQRIIELFNYSLGESGYLMLGHSETIGNRTDLFESVSKRWRIYRRCGAVSRSAIAFPGAQHRHLAGNEQEPTASGARPAPGRKPRLAEVTRDVLLERYAPASVVINHRCQALYFHGPTREYLGQPSGEPTADLLSMTDLALRTRLRGAINAAIHEGRLIRVDGTRIRRGRDSVPVLISVAPIPRRRTGEDLLLVSFEDLPEPAEPVPPEQQPPRDGDDRVALVHQLEQELKTSREELQSTIEELETSNEELTTSNEEAMSLNEELQSSNEELETSKEELQSLNEELSTLNNQLEDKVRDLESATNDLHNLLTSTHLATLFLDTNLHIKWFTPVTQELFNLIASDVGRPLGDITRKFADPELVEVAREVLDHLHVVEREVHTEDGRWYLRRVLPYRTQDNRIDGVVVTFADVSALKEAQQALSEREEQLRRALMDAPLPIALIAEDGEMRMVNRLWCELSGYAPEEIATLEDWTARAYGQGREKVRTWVRHVFQQEQRMDEGEYRIRTRDGGQRIWWFTSSPLGRLPDGRRLLMSIVTDITEARRQQADRERLAVIVESSHDAIIAESLDGIITDWNVGAQQIFGYGAGEAVGRHIGLIIPAERAGEPAEFIQRIRRDERIDQYETVRVRKDGTEFDVSLTISPLRDGEGNIVGTSTIERDITERKRNQDQIQRQAALLSEADRRKDEFLAMLSHELRNPLAPIRNAVEILKLSDNVLDPELHWAREVIDRQLTHLTRLVDDLLDVARITRGVISLQKAPVALAELVHRALETNRPLMESRNQHLSVLLPPEPVSLFGDATRLYQILDNLLNNASKFTPEGGEIHLQARLEDRSVIITVRDNGMGIPADTLPRIFDLFAQGERELDRSHGGLGLGLTLVRSLVELHGGSVAVSSDGADRGCEFRLRLPLSMERAEPASDNRPAADTHGHHILVVDDQVDVGSSLKILLSNLGHRVRVATDGAGALRAVAEDRPDIVLLDIGLPGMDGYEVARRLRADHDNALRLIALTGYGREDDLARSREAGFDHHLLKPVDLEKLRGVLESARPGLDGDRG